jgi:uncharacterized Fe-S cluster-containing protein
MKLMMTIKIPVEHGNQAVKDGSMAKAFENLMDKIKPEAAYFSMLDGYRAAYLVYELDEQYKLLDLHEPMFAAMGALIDERPVLNWDDMGRAFAELQT